jgi:adenylate kinase
MSPSNRQTDLPRGRVILFLGAPGSGKGTQSSRLSSALGLPCLSTGEMLRSEARRNTPAGFRLRRLLNSGALVSDAMVCSVVRTTLTRDTLKAGLVLDGFPRTVQQAAWLDSLLADFGLPVPTVLHLCVSRAELLRRLTARRYCAVCGATYNGQLRCGNDGSALVGRDDDSEKVILRRLAEFDRMSAPLIDYYSGRDYHQVDGEKNPDAIAHELLEIFQPRSSPYHDREVASLSTSYTIG